jgi:hypothetical protein
MTDSISAYSDKIQKMIAALRSQKQRLFVARFLDHGNGTRAAREAKYKGSWASIANENLKKPEIAAIIAEATKVIAMDAEEALRRLSKMARGFNPVEYLKRTPQFAINADNQEFLTGVLYELDLDALDKAGLGDLIKEVKNTSNGPQFVFYDAQDALGDILGYLKRAPGSVEDPEIQVTMTLEEWRAERKERLSSARKVESPYSEAGN